ncbi:MAG TPA: LamG domain-containing protein [Nitrospinaceae bacterium]|nr:LamG domain-containing protein [Nitrospinaceae bacterium]
MRKFTVFSIFFIALFIFLNKTSWAKILPESIVAAWLFDEGSGKTASDSTGNGHDGAIEAGAKWVNGRFGKALEFDGTGDWVSVPHSKNLGFAAGKSFTITVHYKGSKVGGSLVGKNYEDKSQALPWYLLWNDGSSPKVTLYLRDEGGASFRADGTSVVADDKWHFVAAVADASKGKSSIWIDGKKEAEADFNKKSGYGTSEGVVAIGRHYDRYTKGIIDDVGLFNVALTAGDIKTVMNEGLEVSLAVSPLSKLAITWGEIRKR